jgi:hypothetical protein
MTPFPDCPTPEQAQRAVDAMRAALSGFDALATDRYNSVQTEAIYNRATGHLQDALAELGFDLRPLKTQPPATPEAVWTPADWANSRGGM